MGNEISKIGFHYLVFKKRNSAMMQESFIHGFIIIISSHLAYILKCCLIFREKPVYMLYLVLVKS